MKRLKSRDFYIYAVEIAHGGETWTKIGYASNLVQRISAIQTGCPFPITRCLYLLIENDFEARGLAQLLESTLHEGFEKFTRRGEWFEVAMDESLLDLSASAVERICRRKPEWRLHSFMRRKTPRSNAALNVGSNRADIAERARLANEDYNGKFGGYRQQLSVEDISVAYRRPQKAR